MRPSSVRWTIFAGTDHRRTLKNNAGLAAPEPFPSRRIVRVDEAIDQSRRSPQCLGSGKALEDLGELFPVRTPQIHLVLQPPQKGLIAELLGLQVGREDQEGLER